MASDQTSEKSRKKLDKHLKVLSILPLLDGVNDISYSGRWRRRYAKENCFTYVLSEELDQLKREMDRSLQPIYKHSTHTERAWFITFTRWVSCVHAPRGHLPLFRPDFSTLLLREVMVECKKVGSGWGKGEVGVIDRPQNSARSTRSGISFRLINATVAYNFHFTQCLCAT